MIECDILSCFDKMPQKLSAVFIGTWSRGLIEANAFRVACRNLDIECQSVFLIELNSSILERSLTSIAREEYQMELDNIQNVQPYMKDGVITFSNQDFRVYDANTYKLAVGDRTLSPILFIKGDAGDGKLAEGIADSIIADSSIVVIGRNVEPGTYSYGDVIKTWAEQIDRHSRKDNPGLIAFTATDELYASKMYSDMHSGLSRIMPQSVRNLVILTPEAGLNLSHPPNLLNMGANFSDTKLHIIGVGEDINLD